MAELAPFIVTSWYGHRDDADIPTPVRAVWSEKFGSRRGPAPKSQSNVDLAILDPTSRVVHHFDGFPRTLAQADALRALLQETGQKLDAADELKVDDEALVARIVKRAEETLADGQPVRNDDTPEVFSDRLREYYKKTAPLLGYYYATGDLRQVDGMAAMEQVAAQIEALLPQEG